MSHALEAITAEHETQCADNVLAALLDEQGREAERFAIHPMATLPTVCGCQNQS
jgi:hypothetical protein